jgi:hypothetical protein
MDQIRFWGMTVGVTALIWLAVDQSVTTTTEIIVPLNIEPAVADSMMISASRTEVLLVLRGSNSAIAELRTSDQDRSARVILEQRDSGAYRLDLKNELRERLDGFPPGLSVERTMPEVVDVDIFRYVQRQVSVSYRADDVKFNEPQLSPDVVTITVPDGPFDDLERTRQRLELAIDARDASEGEFTCSLPIPNEIGGVPILKSEPREVRFVGEIVGRNARVRLPTVPIRVMFPSNDLNAISAKFRVRFSDHTNDIVTSEVYITGPADIVQAIAENPRQYGVEGYVMLTREEAEKARQPGEKILRTPQFLLPPGVELSEPAPAPVAIELTPLE